MSITPRALVLSLCFILTLPSPSFALRGLNLREDLQRQQELKAGLEAVSVQELTAIRSEIFSYAQQAGISIPSDSLVAVFSSKVPLEEGGAFTPKAWSWVFEQLLQQKKISRPYAMVPYPIPSGDSAKYRKFILAMRQGLELEAGAQVLGVDAGAPFKTVAVPSLPISMRHWPSGI